MRICHYTRQNTDTHERHDNKDYSSPSTNLKGRLSVMFVDDAEGADFSAHRADLGCHINDQLIFVDQSVVTAAASDTPWRRHIQTRRCFYKKEKKKALVK